MRTCNVWRVIEAIKLLRIHGFTTSEISGILRDDLHIRKLSNGEIYSNEGDRDLINLAFSESLEKEKLSFESFYGFNGERWNERR